MDFFAMTMKKEKLTIIKIGGKILDDEEKLNSVLGQFASLSRKKLLVHGGGKTASEILQSMGIKPNMAFGRRVTDSETLKVVQMVYGGLINTNVVAKLQANNCNAIGMNGSDANSIVAVKRPVGDVDYGFVGDIKKVNPIVIMGILEENIVPVFCGLTHDGKGQILNTNADTIASELASALAEFYNVDLVFCFELNGILKNPEDENSVIKGINEKSYVQLKEDQIISDGMIPKMDNAFKALKSGLQNVIITHYKNLEGTSGTRITLE